MLELTWEHIEKCKYKGMSICRCRHVSTSATSTTRPSHSHAHTPIPNQPNNLRLDLLTLCPPTTYDYFEKKVGVGGCQTAPRVQYL